MKKKSRPMIELRTYELNPYFPVKLLAGDCWIISDVHAPNLHFHNCLEIGLCHSDGGCIEFSDTSFSFTAGDVSVISRDIPHTTYSDSGLNSQWSYIHVDLSLLLHPYSTLTSLIELDKLENGFRMLLHCHEHPMIHALVQDIIRELSDRNDFMEDSVRGLFSALSIKLLREQGKQSDYPSLPAHNHFSIKPALVFIQKYYMQTFNITFLAQQCSLSESHFRKIFTEITGYPPLEYINQIRIEKACTLLRISEMSILQISETVGYGSVSSFNRHFLRINGLSPRQYKSENTHLQANSRILKYNGWLVPEKL